MRPNVWIKPTGPAENSVQVKHDTKNRTVLMSNSRFPKGTMLAFSVEEWEAFVGAVDDGEFDLG